MSYLALARKWRPSHFNQVVGQSHVLTALENALNQNKLHHAYLFSGTRGVGKTSIGRLFAKGLNCETGITAKPCGLCDACKEIDEGRFVDLLEIDAASRTKVEDTRELLDNVQYKPARGRFKVYLIDEVHMLSRHSFNALLKTLEEPPEYVKFLLATTDPQKLPVTILSRCLQFHLKPITVDVIHQQLDFILQQERVTSEQRALGMIAHSADGSMRDALSLTDQAIALGNGTVSVDIVSTMLGSLDTDQAIHLLEAMASKQVQSAMLSVNNLAENGVDWDSLLQELSNQLHRIAMYQALPASLDKSKPDAEKIELISQYLTPQDVQLYYQIALKGRQDLAFAPTPRIGLEMVVLRMMAFRPSKVDAASAIELPSGQSQQVASVMIPASSEPTKDTIAVASPTSQPIVNEAASHSGTETEHKAPTQERETNTDLGAQSPVGKQHSDSLSLQQDEQPPLPTESDYPPVPDEYAQEVYSESPVISSQNMKQSTQRAEPHSEVQENSTKRPSAAGLRHQLRSKRAQASTLPVETSGKKSKAAPATSVIERVSQQHSVAKVVSPTYQETSQNVENTAGDGEPYQWKPTTPDIKQKENSEHTPTRIKQALEHTKTSDMVEKLVRESVAQDEWTALIQRLDIAKLVEQLALNSSYEKQGSTIALSLRPSQAHLNKEKAQSELINALNLALGEECHLTIEVSDKGQTPLELRETIYQSKLQVAHQVLDEDKNVQFILTRFSAELDRESVRPI